MALSEEQELLKRIMEENNVSIAELAKRLNISRAALWDRLNGEKKLGLRVPIVEETLDALGYEMKIVPIEGKEYTL